MSKSKVEETAVAEEVKPVEDVKETEPTENDYSPFLYIYSQGCGWCKKSEPIVDELNKDEERITKLDLADGENRAWADDLKKEYNIQCGTPLFINEDTGKFICGFREKDILEKWLAGEDIPAPPRPTGPPPRPPFMGAPEKEEKAWKKEYKKWLKDNEHLPETQRRSIEDVLAQPRPKSDPPTPPAVNATDAEYDQWAKGYDEWKEENSHLPNLQPTDIVLQRLKQRGNPQAAPNPGAAPVVNDAKLNSLDAKIQALEVKVDRIISHFGVK